MNDQALAPIPQKATGLSRALLQEARDNAEAAEQRANAAAGHAKSLKRDASQQRQRYHEMVAEFNGQLRLFGDEGDE